MVAIYAEIKRLLDEENAGAIDLTGALPYASVASANNQAHNRMDKRAAFADS